MACKVGGPNLQGCIVLPAVGTRGGATIFWDRLVVDITSHRIGRFAITVRVDLLSTSVGFWLTTVYGPTDDVPKEEFLIELADAAPPAREPWLIDGDFNMIY